MEDTPEDPLQLFNDWLDEALRSETREATAMVLATADKNGFPSSRIVLLKGAENGRFLFFTGYTSRKGMEIKENNKVSLLFFWPESERQVRIYGTASPLPREETDKYFATRPYESRIGAYASKQSRIIPDRECLEKQLEIIKKEYPEGSEMPAPANWGGYAVSPQRIEFWQGRESRLHDRIEYVRKSKQWSRHRLSP